MKVYSFKIETKKNKNSQKLLKIYLRCDINIEDRNKLLLFDDF